MKKTVGIVFGTFAPLHRGHVDLIQRAKKQFDKVVVVVSGYKDDRGDKIGLKLNKRFRYVREAFAGDEVISVTSLDETIAGKCWKLFFQNTLKIQIYDFNLFCFML